MKKIFIVVLTLIMAQLAHAQNYLARNGKITFFSSTPVENIQAVNNEVVSTINAASGELEFRLTVKSFHFAKTTMEEHFNNESYMSSTKFPKASFKGKFAKPVNFKANGTYNVNVEGTLTIKDVTKNITVPAVITVSGDKITAIAKFKVKRKEYHVYGEAFTQSKLADEIEVTVNCDYDKM
ncbi:MAG: YceI family protein [Chitinophagaceae bacterium]|nr:YceI family protein [Chitinophagaceae bacterium]